MKKADLTSKVSITKDFFESLFNFEGLDPQERGIFVLKRIWGCSSAGRAPALQAGGHRFDPVHLHQGPKGSNNRWFN